MVWTISPNQMVAVQSFFTEWDESRLEIKASYVSFKNFTATVPSLVFYLF